jgi:hypothetical protein
MITRTTSTMAATMANSDTIPDQPSATGANTTSEASPALSPRSKIAKNILVYHFILIGASCLYYLFRGFTFEEFNALMGILAPVTALYGGAVFRFLGRSITEPNLNGQNNYPINSLVKWLVHGHFIVVLTLITLKAFAPNILNFRDMVMFLTFFESAIGVYMGNIILALFETKGKE